MPSRISTGKIIEKGFKFLIDGQSVAGAIRKLKIPKMPGKFAAKRAEIRRVAAQHLLDARVSSFPQDPQSGVFWESTVVMAGNPTGETALWKGQFQSHDWRGGNF
ncbi:MAG: hypothetical protein JWM59_1161 [Verrucomicrobiales bacterium]|nr:hypothetical protein [Verrucomicrobiales bacterium]